MNQKPRIVIINGLEFDMNDLSPEQQEAANHILDLERKLTSATFNVRQMVRGHTAFVNDFMDMLQQTPGSSVG